jgi:hypothetical protein
LQTIFFKNQQNISVKNILLCIFEGPAPKIEDFFENKNIFTHICISISGINLTDKKPSIESKNCTKRKKISRMVNDERGQREYVNET